MNNLTCPYCEHDCGDYIDDCHEPDTQYEYTCPECDKNFIFSISYYPTFSSEKADCLNGAEHNFEKITGYPIEYFENKRRCSMCSKEIIVEKENSNTTTGVSPLRRSE
jgi:DNA-directed RNA polymerase subunit RPC12/RpoP